jgi:TolA-binding protein
MGKGNEQNDPRSKSGNRSNKEKSNQAILEIENSKETETTQESITNKVQGIEERISDMEDTIEKIDTSIKENYN